MELKLGDFGLAAQVDNSRSLRTTFCGPYHYLAPEQIDTDGYGYEIDAWAVGVILYTLYWVGLHLNRKTMI